MTAQELCKALIASGTGANKLWWVPAWAEENPEADAKALVKEMQHRLEESRRKGAATNICAEGTIQKAMRIIEGLKPDEAAKPRTPLDAWLGTSAKPKVQQPRPAPTQPQMAGK